MKIGMIVAIRREIDALIRTCGEPLGVDEIPGYRVFRYRINDNELFVCESGAGELSAASTTQLLITKYEVELIVNFGVCGGLVPEMALNSTVVVDRVVHYDIDTSTVDERIVPGQYLGNPDIYIRVDEKILEIAKEAVPGVKFVTCASGDKFVDGSEKKNEMHEMWNAEICEMEAAGILITAKRNSVPALLVKGVSDSVTGGAEEFGKMVHEAATACFSMLLKIIENGKW